MGFVGQKTRYKVKPINLKKLAEYLKKKNNG